MALDLRPLQAEQSNGLDLQPLDPNQDLLGIKSKPVLGQAPKSRFQKGVANVKKEFQPGGGGRAFVDPFIGAGKTGLEFARGASSLGERLFKGIGRTITPKKFEAALGFEKPVQTAAEKLIPESLTEKTSGFQQLGGLAVDIGSFALPGAAGLKIKKTAGILLRMAAEAATFGGVTALKEGEVGKEAVISAALGGAIPVVGVLGAGVKSFLGKYLPQALTKSAIKLTPTQKEAVSNISSGGKTAEEFLLNNQITGSPAQISKKLLEKSAQIRSEKLNLLGGLKGLFKNTKAEQMINVLEDTLSVPGLEIELKTVKEIGKSLRGKGSPLSMLDELKTIADAFKNPFKLSGGMKEAAQAKGFAKLRRGLKVFIEDEAGKLGQTRVKELNNQIRLTRKIGDAVAKQDLGAGGNAIAKLSDLIVGGSVFGGVGGISEGFEGAIKGAILGTGAVLLRRLFTPEIKVKLAQALSKSFNRGEAGRLLRFLQGADIPLNKAEKGKLAEALIKIGAAKK